MPAEPSPIPRSALSLGHRHLILPLPNHPITTLLSPQNTTGLRLPAIPHPIASRALRVRGRDGVAALVGLGCAGAFGQLPALEDVVVVVVAGFGFPAVADVVVGCPLVFGGGDDVVGAGCGCCLGELAFLGGRLGCVGLVVLVSVTFS